MRNDPWQEIKDTPKASVGKRVQTLRISAFALMAKYEKPLEKLAHKQGRFIYRRESKRPNRGTTQWYEGAYHFRKIIIDAECLETLVFGASPP